MSLKSFLVLCAVAVVTISVILIAGDSGDSDSGSGNSSDDPQPSVIAGYDLCAGELGSSSLIGAGATFPYPFYSKVMDVYGKACGIRINYQSIGSGAGIQQITAKTVDFGASDGIMRPDQEEAAVAAGGPILHLPMTLAPVAIVYNLPGIDSGELRLTGPVLADIYLKNIKRWNDERIAALNPGLELPKGEISVVYRSDGSGTTNIFTDYLSKVSPEWKDEVGSGNSVRWPGDVGGQGNEGVAGQVKLLPGTIGYLEVAFAELVNLPTAQLQNSSGRWVMPTLEAASAAAQGVTLPDDMKIVLTDTANPAGYPITSFSWILAYRDAPDPAKGRTLAHFLWWAIHDGQRYAEPLHFPMLPEDAVEKAEAQILSLRCGGEPCLMPAPASTPSLPQ